MKFIVKIYVCLAVIAAILLVVFVAQNADYITLYFFAHESEMPLSVLLFITFMIGGGVGMFASYLIARHNKRATNRNKHIEDVERENIRLRSKINNKQDADEVEIQPSDEQQ